jgi:hypothetical protein
MEVIPRPRAGSSSERWLAVIFMTRNEQLWDAVGTVLDLAENLEGVIGTLTPGTRSEPLAKAIDNLVQTISNCQENMRRVQEDSDLQPEDRWDCEEGLEALDGLLLRLERTRQQLKVRIARNRKRLRRRVIAFAVLPALLSYVVCSCLVTIAPTLPLPVHMVVGLGIGIIFGLVFVKLTRWWDRPGEKPGTPAP